MFKITVFSLFLIILFNQNSMAQIDTNDVYPLHKGNLWEYTNYIDVHYYEVIVGEETMPNGRTYKKRMSVNLVDSEYDWDTLYTFWRVEDEQIFENRGNFENKMYDLPLPVGSVWQMNDSSTMGRKVSLKQILYFSMFSDSLTYFFMEYVLFDTLQNPPDTSLLVDVWDGFVKGVGPTYNTSGVKLTGAIINGKQYGYVTVDVKEEKPILSNYKIEIDTYPNPFNGNCNIVFNIEESQNIELKIFNILGEELFLLYKGELQKGEKHFNLNMPNEIGSGIFFIRLETEKQNYIKKILYLK